MEGKYCYRCGAEHHNSDFCPSCGERLNLHPDVYAGGEVCYTCEKPVPRWSNYCPYCAERQEKNDDAGYPKQWKKYRRNLILGNCIWTLAIAYAAVYLPGHVKALTIEMAVIAAPLFILAVWGFSLSAIRRGGYWEGTVTRLYTEPGTKKVCVDAGRFEDVPCTIYKTQIKWDNGKILERSEKDNCADHEQLRVGDRVRLYKGISRFAKL